MNKTRFGGVLLLGALTFSLLAQAQQPEQKFRLHSTDLAVTYAAEGGKIAYSKSDRFWMHGGSAEAAFTLYRGLGMAFNLSGEGATGLRQGVDFSKITFVAGPRYTYVTTRWTERLLKSKRATSVFGQTLFGTVHGFNGLFPASATTVKSSADAFAMQTGGGIDVALAKGFGLRALQLDYIRTTLPNNGTNAQHDVRMGIGLTYHIQGH